MFNVVLSTERIAELMGRLHGGGPPLSEAERNVALVSQLDLEVHIAGSLVGFFEGPSADAFDDTLAALKVIGANEMALVLEEAGSTFAVGKPPAEKLGDLFERYEAATAELEEALSSYAQAHLSGA